MQEGKDTSVALQTEKGQIMCNYCAPSMECTLVPSKYSFTNYPLANEYYELSAKVLVLLVSIKTFKNRAFVINVLEFGLYAFDKLKGKCWRANAQDSII